MNIYADQLSIVNRYMNYKDNHYVWNFKHSNQYDCIGVYTENEIFHAVIESVIKLVYTCPFVNVTEKAEEAYYDAIPAVRSEDVYVGTDSNNYDDSDETLKGLFVRKQLPLWVTLCIYHTFSAMGRLSVDGVDGMIPITPDYYDEWLGKEPSPVDFSDDLIVTTVGQETLVAALQKFKDSPFSWELVTPDHLTLVFQIVDVDEEKFTLIPVGEMRCLIPVCVTIKIEDLKELLIEHHAVIAASGRMAKLLNKMK